MEKLVQIVKDYEAYVRSDEYHEDNDWKHYIYEAAVEAVLGERSSGFWKVLNSK